MVAIDRERNFGAAKPRTVSESDSQFIFTGRKRKLRLIAILNVPWDLLFGAMPFYPWNAVPISDITKPSYQSSAFLEHQTQNSSRPYLAFKRFPGPIESDVYTNGITVREQRDCQK
jgi:hypothetical protein